MQITIQNRPIHTSCKIIFDPGETLTAESGSMIAMSSGLDVETTTHKRGKGSLLKSIKRLFAGESFFLNHYTARSGGELRLAPPLPGDLQHLDLQGEKWIIQASSFLAAADSVEIDVGFQGMKNILSGESLFWIHASGRGDLLLSSFGEMYPVDVDGEYIVDSGHIVAYSEGLDFSLSKAGSSWFTSFLGGEGIVSRFKGKGRVWCQSHNPKAFGEALSSHLKVKEQG